MFFNEKGNRTKKLDDKKITLERKLLAKEIFYVSPK